MKPIRDLNKLLVASKPFIPKIPKPVMPRPTRGPTVRWDIDYDKLFGKRRK